jgi:hypothetical protein
VSCRQPASKAPLVIGQFDGVGQTALSLFACAAYGILVNEMLFQSQHSAIDLIF